MPSLLNLNDDLKDGSLKMDIRRIAHVIGLLKLGRIRSWIMLKVF